ncbi:MAG: Nif3-like dinuclear metal center hexameric protein [Acidimicrobiia bacterium]
MTIAELLERLGNVAPWDKAADWDPVGLQLGDPAAEATSVAVCHEITDEVVRLVTQEPSNLVVTYHPLLFEPRTTITAGPGPSGRAYQLLTKDIAVAVVHTNFDAAAGGAADALAETLGLDDIRPLAPAATSPAVKIVTFVPESHVGPVRQAMADAGGGVIGNYTNCSFRVAGLGSFFASEATSPSVGQEGQLNEEPESRLEMVAPKARADAVLGAMVAAHPYEEPAFDVYDIRGAAFYGRVGRLVKPTPLAALAKEVAERLDAHPVRYVGHEGTPLQELAVVPGSGAEFIDAARAGGAEALVTGDVSHHRAVGAAERGLAVIDPGHAGGERPGVRRLLEVVRKLVPSVRDLTGWTTDPWSWTQ